MKWLFFEEDFYWVDKVGQRTSYRPSILPPEQYTLVTYWRPRWRWLRRFLNWKPAYEP